MVEDAHFAGLGAAPATGEPKNAFSRSVIGLPKRKTALDIDGPGK